MSANKYKTNHERMLELIEKLNEADIAYYRDDNPIMSDRDYDILMDELKGLEKDTGLVLSNSPTQKVSGEILEQLTPVRHTRPMLSADKIKSVDDLAKFAAGKDVMNTVSWCRQSLGAVKASSAKMSHILCVHFSMCRSPYRRRNLLRCVVKASFHGRTSERSI